MMISKIKSDSQEMKKAYQRMERIIEREGLGNKGCRMRKDRENHEEKDRVMRIKGKGDHVGKEDNGYLVKIESRDPIDLREKMLKNDNS